MFKTILLHKLCDLDHKVVLLRWSDRGTSLWERYMSAAERNNRQSAVWLSVLEERSEQWKTIFVCFRMEHLYLVCYKTSLIYKAPYLGVFQPIIHLESTRTYLMWFRSGTIDKAPLWCAWYWRNIFLVCQKSTVLPFCMLKIDVAPFLVCYRCG